MKDTQIRSVNYAKSS